MLTSNTDGADITLKGVYMNNIALQLYSIRENIAKLGYQEGVRTIAEMGYRAVETAGFPGTNPQKAAKLFQDLGIKVVSAHTGTPIGNDKNKILDELAVLGNPKLVCSQIGPEDVKTLDSIKALCARLNEGYEASRENGVVFGIHNHWWEFGQVNGRNVHEFMVELLDPGIFFEIDTYWAKVGGADPIRVINNLSDRVPLLHIKDGPGTREAAMQAIGQGVMDFPALMKEAGSKVEWLIVELDRCDTDMLTALKESYNYLAAL
jgi:sugar phosphate isomerase/epimerase